MESMAPVISVTAVALAGAFAGVWLVSGKSMGRLLLPFSAGLLGGMAFFGIWPEVAEIYGAMKGLLLLLSGFAALWFIDRRFKLFCPVCSHTHDHGACSQLLHGFAPPLVAAAVMHSFMDGVAVGSAGHEGSSELAWGVVLAVGLHKIPEGLAYGTILRAALPSRLAALLWSAAAQSPTLIGGLLEPMLAERTGAGWVALPLALAGSSFFYVGFHAAHAEYRSRGAASAIISASAGILASAVILIGLHSFAH